MNKLKLEVRPGFCIALSVAMLLLPIKWLLAWLAAACLHELGHYAALRLCGCSVASVTLGANGAEMAVEELHGKKGALCALSGPLCGLLLLLFLRTAPRLALCGLVQSLYNLLPVYPLDGGRALRCLLGADNAIAQTVQNIVEYAVLGILLIAAFYAMLRLELGLLPVMAVLLLFVRSGKIKIPCKHRLKGVQ